MKGFISYERLEEILNEVEADIKRFLTAKDRVKYAGQKLTYVGDANDRKRIEDRRLTKNYYIGGKDTITKIRLKIRYQNEKHEKAIEKQIEKREEKEADKIFRKNYKKIAKEKERRKAKRYKLG
jgi:hypothetical protein